MLRHRGTIFYRFFLILLLSISVPLWIITEVSVRYSSDHIIRQATQFNLDLLAQRKKILEQAMSELANLSYHMLERQDIWTLVMSGENVSQEYFLMRNAIGYMTSAVSTQANIQSMYLFNDQDDFVLSDARYSKSDFPDPSVLHPQMSGTFKMLAPRHIKSLSARGLDEGPEVISYIRKFTGNYNKRESYLVINLYADMFFEDVQLNESPPDILIVNRQHEVLFHSGTQPPPLEAPQLERIIGETDESFLLKDDESRYYVFKKEMPGAEWTIVALHDYAALVESAALVRSIVFYSFGIVLLVSLGLAYVISAYLYKPLMQIMRKIRKAAGLQAGESGNEYQLIDYTISNLFTRNDELTSKYNLIFPYFSRYFLGDLIGGRPLDAIKFDQMLALLGIRFPFGQYAIVLFDTENAPFDLAMKQQADQLLDAHQASLRHVLAKVDDRRAMIVLNTDEPMQVCYERIRAVKKDFNHRQIDITMAMSGFVGAAEALPQAYREAEQLLESKFFIGKNELITDRSWQGGADGMSAGRRLEKQLLEHVKAGHLDKAEETLGQLASDLLSEQAGIDYIRYIFNQFCTDMVEALAELGFDVQEEFPDGKTIFGDIQQAQTMDELKAYALALMRQAVTMLDRIKQVQHLRIVTQAKAFIQDNYHRDISLDDVAGSVYLSAGYLSIIYKEQTGTTIYDSITTLRMQMAAELLRSRSGIKVQEVAERVGFNNVQSFLRHFKRQYGMTPIQYRRTLGGGNPNRSES